jgi:hypothetical protein
LVNKNKKQFDSNRIIQNPTSSSDYFPKDKIDTNMINDEWAWEYAHNEILNDRNQGLWVKCLYSTNQDEDKAREMYVISRVKQLKNKQTEESIAAVSISKKRDNIIICIFVLIYILCFALIMVVIF